MNDVEHINSGYQRDDTRIIDYQLTALGGIELRGPTPDLGVPYFSVLGAAQVFGRFVADPFPRQIEREIGLNALNLGASGAGPSFYLQRPRLLELANKGKFAIVQLMSGRSLSNSRFKAGVNQGVLLDRATGGEPTFAEDAYRTFLETARADAISALRVENRDIYVREMRSLLDQIKVRKILLYWSRRPVEYREGTSDIGAYWGDFPHFVDRDVVDALLPSADEFVEVVGAPGLPQPLFDRGTGAPVLMWPEQRFPNVKLREHNHYYPSPEMHQQVAEALTPVCVKFVHPSKAACSSAIRTDRPRVVLLHLHIFKNAGSSFDLSLKESFGESWRAIDPARIEDALDGNALVRLLTNEPALKALSSHQARFPDRSEREGIKLHPVVFLRHPLLRVQSIYAYERMAGRQETSSALHTVKANALDFPAWVDWCLSSTLASGPVADYQTRICSQTANGLRETDWQQPVRLINYQEAVTNLAPSSVGIVEEYARSLKKMESEMRELFPELVLSDYADNVTSGDGRPVLRTLTGLLAELGPNRYARLCEANRFDLLLYQRFAAI